MEAASSARCVIAEAAPAAAEAPALGLLVIGLLALLGWAVCRGLRAMWMATLGLALYELGDLLRIDVAFVHWHPGNAVKALADDVSNWLAEAAAKSDGAAGYLFHESAVLAEWGVRELEYFTHETAATFDWLVWRHLPRYVKWAIEAAVPPILIYKLARAAIAAELPSIRRLIKSATHTTEVTVTRLPAKLVHEVEKDHGTLTRLGVIVGALAGTLTWPGVLDIPSPVKLWRGLTKRLARIERRLARLEALLGVAGMAVAMANVLGLPSWRCLTRGNIGRTSRALCGLGPQALEGLLSFLVDALVITRPCDTITVVTAAADLILEPVGAIATDIAANIDGCGYKLAPPLVVAQTPNPPLQTTLTLGV